jgi:hypothetical protein
MTEKIDVTYLHVQGATFHMALFYDNGNGIKRVIEAASQFNILKRDNFEQLFSPHKNIFFTAISVCIRRYCGYGWRKAAAQSSVVATEWGTKKRCKDAASRGGIRGGVARGAALIAVACAS